MFELKKVQWSSVWWHWRLMPNPKEKPSLMLWQPSALEGNLTMGTPFLHPPKRALHASSVWPRREYTWTLNWEESLVICFENCQGVPCSHRKSRNRMMNSFIIVNIIPTHVRDSLGEKSMLAHSKKAFLLSSVWSGIE